MVALFDLLLDICLFRKGPQHIPAAPILLQLALFGYGLSSFLLLLITLPVNRALPALVLDMFLLYGLTALLLYSSGLYARFTQTLTALAATSTFFQLIAWPVTMWFYREYAMQGFFELPFLLQWLIVLWNIAVMSHILYFALSVSRPLSVSYALAYVVIYWLISYPLTG